jgi:polar amino acid transport system substrate-binding protein
MKIFFFITFFIFSLIKIFPSQGDKDEIIVGIKNSPPFIIKNSDNKYSGLSIDLWNKIADSLNIKYTFKEYNLPGLIKALENNKIDLCINPLTVTSNRVKKIDFTQPFFITNLAIATKRESGNNVILFITKFFSIDFIEIVLILFLVILIFGILVWFFERKHNQDQFEKNMKGIWSGIWWSAVTMTTVGYGDKSPQSLGGRIVALIWMFTAIITISSFTASITSSLTINKLNNKIKGPGDLKNFTVGSIKSSTSDIYLQNKEIEHVNFPNIKDGLEAIDNNKIAAFVYDEPILRYTISENDLQNTIIILPSKFNTQYYSFSLPKKSKLLDKINPLLLKEINSPSWSDILSRYNLFEKY